MKSWFATMMVLCMCAGIAFAQVVCPPGTVAIPSTVTTATVTGVCPAPVGVLPELCPVVVGENINGDFRVFVLGSQEDFVAPIESLENVNWRETPLTARSIYPFNPLTSHRPNVAMIRHGNPYYPYYALNADVEFAGFGGALSAFPGSVNRGDRATLTQLALRYQTLTPQSAMAMGYQPLGVCAVGVGVPYVNRALIDNIFDPMQPEAFSFSPEGRLLAVHYLATTPQPFIAFGQMSISSPIVQNAQHLPVWLFERNTNGMFALQNNTNYCPVVAVVPTVTPIAVVP